MSVFNGEAYLDEAIKSILLQTYTDFEFIILDDGSTDKSAQIINRFLDKDKRIVFIKMEKNFGLAITPNFGIHKCKGKYIIRMDADDISLPNRFEKQVAFMDSHPEIGLAGTWIRTFGDGDNRIIRFPLNPAIIKCSLLFNQVMCNASLIIRRDVLQSNNLYFDASYRGAHDYDLIASTSKYVKLANIGEVLFLYRIHPKQDTQQKIELNSQGAGMVRKKQLGEIGIEPSQEEYEVHQYLLNIMGH